MPQLEFRGSVRVTMERVNTAGLMLIFEGLAS